MSHTIKFILLKCKFSVFFKVYLELFCYHDYQILEYFSIPQKETSYPLAPAPGLGNHEPTFYKLSYSGQFI